MGPQLRDLVHAIAEASGRGLRLHGQLCASDVRPLQELLERTYLLTLASVLVTNSLGRCVRDVAGDASQVVRWRTSGGGGRMCGADATDPVNTLILGPTHAASSVSACGQAAAGAHASRRVCAALDLSPRTLQHPSIRASARRRVQRVGGMAAKGSAGKAGAIDLERYRNDPTATALDLAGQKLTSSQLSDVASLLDKSKALTDLNVEKCQVRTCPGAFRAVPAHRARAQLGDDKISSLAKVLENNTQLKKLNLQYNLLSRNALKNLEKSVHNNLSLIDLKIKEKPMDVNGLRLDGLPGATLKSIDDCIRENQLIAKVSPPPRTPHRAAYRAARSSQARAISCAFSTGASSGSPSFSSTVSTSPRCRSQAPSSPPYPRR